MSLRARLLLALLPLFVVGLVAADGGTYAALQSFLTSRVDAQLREAARPLEARLQGRPGGQLRGGNLPIGTYAALVDPSGRVLATQSVRPGFGQSTLAAPRLPSPLPPTGAHAVEVTLPGSGTVSSYRARLDTLPDGSGDVFVLAIPLDEVRATLGQLLVLEFLVSLVVVVVVAAAAGLLVHRGLRPLERMGAAARKIATGDLAHRVEPASERTEVGRLGLALNQMLTSLERAFAQRSASEQRLRTFISDTSHELRTPLTSIRGYAELMRRTPDMPQPDRTAAIDRIEGESVRMSELVDDLLLLARLDQGRPLERAAVDLGVLVTEAVADATAVDGGRSVSALVTEPVVVRGDASRLRQAVTNLIANALVHTPAGTPVEVSATSSGERAIIDCVDHGGGIPVSLREVIFERFQRVDPERSRDRGGSGLGLSIVAGVVAAHGGTVEVRDTEGGGATFHIEIPGLAHEPDASPPSSPPPSPPPPP